MRCHMWTINLCIFLFVLLVWTRLISLEVFIVRLWYALLLHVFFLFARFILQGLDLLLLKWRKLPLQSVLFFKRNFNRSQVLLIEPIAKVRKHQLHQRQVDIFELFGVLAERDIVSHQTVADDGKILHLRDSEVFNNAQSLLFCKTSPINLISMLVKAIPHEFGK